MSVGKTSETIRFRNDLTLQQVQDFKKFEEHLECIFTNTKFYENIQIGQYNFPANDRPRSMCRWFLSSSHQRLCYDDSTDDFLYKERDTISEMFRWLKYLIKYFFVPNNIIISGKLTFFSVDDTIFGKAHIYHNVVEKTIYEKTFDIE